MVVNNSIGSYIFLSVLFLLCLCSTVSARVLPTSSGESTFGVEVLRNLEERHNYWGGNVGYCWRGRIDLRLEYRHDDMLGRERLALKGEIALLVRRGFILESGYHRTLVTKNRAKYHLIPVRTSFPIRAAERLFIIPRLTYMQILAENSDAMGFVGIDFLWDYRYLFGLEMNVNQDFRYHAIDIRLGYHW